MWIAATAGYMNRVPPDSIVNLFLLACVSRYHGGFVDFNEHGRHVLHEMAEQWRHTKAVLDGNYNLQTMTISSKRTVTLTWSILRYYDNFVYIRTVLTLTIVFIIRSIQKVLRLFLGSTRPE